MSLCIAGSAFTYYTDQLAYLNVSYCDIQKKKNETIYNKKCCEFISPTLTEKPLTSNTFKDPCESNNGYLGAIRLKMRSIFPRHTTYRAIQPITMKKREENGFGFDRYN